MQHSVFVSMTGRYSGYLMNHFSIGHLFLICILYVAAVLLNLLACIWFYVATLEGLENSWLTSVGTLLPCDTGYVLEAIFQTIQPTCIPLVLQDYTS